MFRYEKLEFMPLQVAQLTTQEEIEFKEFDCE